MQYGWRVVVGALLVALAACGDSSEETPTDSAPTSVAATSAPTTEAAESAATTEETTSVTEPDPSEVSPKNCPELVAVIGGAANAAATATADPAVGMMVENTRALADRIPEIADDLRLIADAYENFLEQLEELGVDLTDPTSLLGLDPAAMEELSAAAESLDEADLAEANQNVQAFFERECS